jgi:thiamine monophosphate kinase
VFASHGTRTHLLAPPSLAGDDAAVLRMAGTDECVITVGLFTDRVDFEVSQIDPRRAGRKALAINLSDLAALDLSKQASSRGEST